ncbi:Dabb family protein [Aquibaculum arenosum]|uniref:Dabb family protein n=1 Tax=Aquibaculum arenosum TaxID=3032591 RepID=A0ABT5YI29_9PROT|nr:Dabb family protein [Fodinicurvata sp. CAU 1616]MDF2094588.1 Dabb family protein [Fodinicurvata sp. CAU 1616]
MLRHIVFFSAKDPQDIERIQELLMQLGTIPSVRHFEVGQNIRRDQFSSEVDLVVYGEFEDEAALQAYKAHPTYAECIRQVKPLRDLRVAADVRADVT